MSRRVTFSRNYTLSLSRTCQCYCKYCAFKTHQAHLHDPDEVERQIEQAVRRNAKELLVLTGERPEVNPRVAEMLAGWGHGDFTSYVAWACERALARGLLPHTNIGVIDRRDLGRLRDVTASQGLMLESLRDDLPAHQGSPTKSPAVRLEMIEAAGELKIPFTSGILVGIGETEADRFAALDALAGVHRRHGHIQEVILQNFVPHDSYYGLEVAELADETARRFWATGVGDRPAADLPDWATGVTVEELERLVDYAARALPGVGIQVPPNLSGAWPELVRAGATDLGGLSANGDHLSPEQPVPSPTQVRRELRDQGVAVSERLCVYPSFIDSEWLAPSVLDTIASRYWSFIPRGGSGRREPPFPLRPGLAAGAIERASRGEELTPQELTALFAERRPEVVEEIRLAADARRSRPGTAR
ncbi:MAG: 7,8-didemethyl-8-hydroxy-5-deazariboflavin synthase subunit CofG [Solirubrobacterales bacterium]